MQSDLKRLPTPPTGLAHETSKSAPLAPLNLAFVQTQEWDSRTIKSAGLESLSYSSKAELDRLRTVYEFKLGAAERQAQQTSLLEDRIEAMEKVVEEKSVQYQQALVQLRQAEKRNQGLEEELELLRQLLKSTTVNLEAADIQISDEVLKCQLLEERLSEAQKRNEESENVKAIGLSSMDKEITMLKDQVAKKDATIKSLTAELEQLHVKLFEHIEESSALSEKVQSATTSPSPLPILDKSLPSKPGSGSPIIATFIETYDSNGGSDISKLSLLSPKPKNDSKVLSIASSSFGFPTDNENIKACEKSGQKLVNVVTNALSTHAQIIENMKTFLLCCKAITNECEDFEVAFDTTHDEKESMLDMQDLLARSLTKLMETSRAHATESKPDTARAIKEEVERTLFTISCMGQMIRNKQAERNGVALPNQSFPIEKSYISEMETLKSVQYDYELHRERGPFSVGDLMISNTVRNLILTMQTPKAEEQVPGIIKDIVHLCDRIITESRSTLIASVEISNELYLAVDECLLALTDCQKSIQDLCDSFTKNSRNRLIRQHMTDQTFAITKVIKELVYVGEKMHESVSNLGASGLREE
ncbi:hypothetical protein HDU91_006046 [Kappamyces sp. JEL0680]|nr:hypothetical protein HDU91_006046 [Kappamyces sp. JEL0680]